jgi:hypothetical protein
MRRTAGWCILAVALSACVEKLATPGSCPELCPGDRIIVRDTTILPVPAGDSSHFGYLPRAARTAMLVSNGLAAGEARGFVIFPRQRTDSIQVDGTLVEFTVDTVAISFALQARDTTATGLKVFLHRIPITVDTTLTFDQIDALLTNAAIIDSIEVPDSVRASDRIEALFVEDELALLTVPPDDSGRIGIGLTVRASKPTGIILGGDAFASANAPVYESRGKADVPDEDRQRQRPSVRPDDPARVGYVFNADLGENPDPDLLYVGGPRAARALIRFDLPPAIKDSAQILRATLELTPALPLVGLPNYEVGDTVLAQGVVADLGAKSPPLVSFGLQLGGGLEESTTNLVEIDLLRLVTQWQIEDGPPAVVFIAHLHEGQTFMQPVFHSTRSPAGSPRLRITYGLPTRPGRP